MLGWLVFDLIAFFKPKIKEYLLNLVYYLEARHNIILRSKKNGFELAEKEYNKIQIANEIERLKIKNQPVSLEPLSCREWKVITKNIETLEYETIEITVTNRLD
jgi:hypothetical protein